MIVGLNFWLIGEVRLQININQTEAVLFRAISGYMWHDKCWRTAIANKISGLGHGANFTICIYM